jgi:hypothetical protein
VAEVTWDQVLGWRMRRQFLAELEAPSSIGVAERLAGIQAQVASAAELAVAVRGGPPDAMSDPGLVKTWAMRGTLHLLPLDTAGAYLALVGTVRNWEKPSWQKTFGTTPADLEAIAAAAAEVLVGGVALTREELTAEIIERTGSSHLAEVLRSGWGTLLKPLAWWGVLCYGPPRGGQVTFTTPSYGLPSVEEAARIVIPAFLGAHGPATPEMFDNWLVRKVSRKKELHGWFAAAADLLTTVSVEGVEMYAVAAHAAELLDARPSTDVRLLGGFDQYILGAGTDATYLVPPSRRAEVSRTGGWISPVVLSGGRVAGVWDATGGAIAVTPFTDLPAAPLETEITRVTDLLV